MVNSKNKGNAYERKIAKLLSEWWRDEFYRTPGSGSWNTTHKASESQAGDIVVPPDSLFPFVVEAKNREGWTFENYLLNNGQPKSWWDQVVRDSLGVKKIPMLIAHRNRSNSFVTIPYSSEIELILEEKECRFCKHVIINEEKKYPVLTAIIEDFCSVLTPEYLKSNHNKIFSNWYEKQN